LESSSIAADTKVKSLFSIPSDESGGLVRSDIHSLARHWGRLSLQELIFCKGWYIPPAGQKKAQMRFQGIFIRPGDNMVRGGRQDEKSLRSGIWSFPGSLSVGSLLFTTLAFARLPFGEIAGKSLEVPSGILGFRRSCYQECCVSRSEV
jgi:hypothetical protein